MTTPIRHRFIAIDEGHGTLLHVNQYQQKSSSPDWIVPIGQPQARDMQLVGNDRILISHHHGFSEFDIHTGAKLLEFAALEGITSARRQPDGSTLLAGVNLAGETGVTLLFLSPAPENKIIRCATYGGDYVRLIRQTTDNTCLFMCDSSIRLSNTHGAYLADYPVAGFQHTWKALRLPDGRHIASAGYGAFMAELDAHGKLIRHFGARDQLPDAMAINPFFYAMFQLLENNHVVVANWQGHGPGHGGDGVQLLEFDAAGQLVWQWQQPPSLVSSLQGIVVLDNLDTGRLHDERTGIMAPQ